MSVPPFLNTVSGRTIDLEQPARSQFFVRDIVRGLAAQPRFGGQTNQPWSVLQHSLAAYELAQHMQGRYKELAGTQLAMRALLHDASEAYLCDIPSPAKVAGDRICDYHSGLQNAIYAWAKIGYCAEEQAALEKIDNILLHAEAERFQRFNSNLNWPLGVETVWSREPALVHLAGLSINDLLMPKRGFSLSHRFFTLLHDHMARVAA